MGDQGQVLGDGQFGAVPVNGFWKTRPISAARRYSGQRVMYWPARRMRWTILGLEAVQTAANVVWIY
jgi:hypothetical protein